MLSTLYQWFSQSQAATFVFGPGGEGLFANEAGRQMLRWEGESGPSLERVSEAMRDPGQHRSAVQALQSAGREALGHRVQRADGVWLTCDYRPFAAAEGTIHVWECRPSPDPEGPAQPLSKSTYQLRALVQHLQTGLLLEDEDRFIVLVNEAMLSLFRIPATIEQMLGADCRESAEGTSLMFADPDGFLAGVEARLRERKPVFGEQLALADGRVLLRDYIPVFVDDEYGGHLWQYQDISEQISSAEALQASNRRKSAILSEALDAIVTVDAAGDVIEWNPAAEVTFGYTSEEAIGKNMASLIVPAHLHDAHKAGMERYLKTGEAKVMGNRVELEAHHKSGHHFPCELSIAEFQEDGKQFFTGFLRDISNRREAEEAMVAARDLAESTSKAKDLFLANMSHEIRTPLNVMLGMVELLQDTRLTMTQQEYIRAIAASGESLLQLINDFLDTSKIEARQIELVHTSFDLHELVSRVVSLIRLRVEPKGVRMRAKIEPGVPQFVAGDPNRLHQILLNLMGNAAKFTSKGSISLVVERDNVCEASPTEPTVCVAFSVRDTGIGIAEESQPFIFERFFQAEHDHAKKNEGTGLGLSICRALVELMGGSLVLASSTLGEGSHFRANLPFAFGAEPKHTPSHSLQVPTLLAESHELDESAPRILLAEDNLDNRMFVERVLQPAGYRIDCVVDGVEVVQAMTRETYDLVLMDVEMPRRDGIETTRFIREWERKDQRPPTPIVALTAHALQGYRQLCAEAGMDDYFTKPIRKTDLLSLVGFWTQTKKDILIVDDSSETRTLFGKYLEPHVRCDLRYASSGEEALIACRAAPPTLLILDMQLEGMSGYETAAALRAEGMTFPILAVSGNDAPEQIEASLSAGCDEYLMKPVRRRTFLDAVGQLTRETRPTSQAQEATEPPGGEPTDDPQDPATRGPIHVAVDPDLVDLIPLFLANRQRDLEQLKHLFRQGEFAKIALIAHKFKGSSGGYGFLQLSVIGGAMEKAALAEASEEVEAHIATMADYLKRVAWSPSETQAERSADEG